jgi:hypothetical protein
MLNTWSRRNLLRFSTLGLPLFTSLRGRDVFGFEAPSNPNGRHPPVPDLFPTQSPELAREMVTVAHFDLNRVKELVEARPSLACAAWDWGFGDWETALGGASHMGNRAIAEYLISKGARPSLFSATMFGQLEVVKAFVAAQPGVQRIRGPHSISLLAHAKAGGEAARPVYEFLKSLGGADRDPQAPLSEEDITALLGTYVFGVGANQQIELTEDHGQITWTRRGFMGRPLFHLGNRAFYPWGAPAVRIQFEETAGAMRMTIKDADWELTAQRKETK